MEPELRSMASPSVLIVEDDPALLRGLKDNFEAQGYSVLLARDGAEGCRSALANCPDLLLLDVMLPKTNGYQICREVRARQLETAIIMITAKGQEEDIIRGLELGADDYVTKPFNIRDLLVRAKGFLRRRQAEAASLVRFSTCTLDLAARRVSKDGQEITLTAKEFRLLEFLARRPGRALTRDQILDAVWGTDIMINDRSVDRCVTTLRSKIEPDPHHPTCIQTIRDIGYRFCDKAQPY
jgi:DNA-binding response OmpR family regulator